MHVKLPLSCTAKHTENAFQGMQQNIMQKRCRTNLLQSVLQNVLLTLPLAASGVAACQVKDGGPYGV